MYKMTIEQIIAHLDEQMQAASLGADVSKMVQDMAKTKKEKLIEEGRYNAYNAQWYNAWSLKKKITGEM